MASIPPQSKEVRDARQRVRFLLDVGRYREALAILNISLSVAPEDSWLLCSASLAHYKLQEYMPALEFANRAIANAPDEEWGHRLRSHILLDCYPRSGPGFAAQRDEALRSATEAVRLAPRGRFPLYVLVLAQLASGLVREAGQTATRLLEVAPESGNAHEAMALVCIRRHKWRQARTYCENALRINPKSYAATNNLGLALMHSGKLRQALVYFFRAARMSPDREVARSNLRKQIRVYMTLPLGVGILAILFLSSGGLFHAALAVAGPLAMYAVLLWVQFRRLPADLREYIFKTRAHGRMSRLPEALVSLHLSEDARPLSDRLGSLKRWQAAALLTGGVLLLVLVVRAIPYLFEPELGSSSSLLERATRTFLPIIIGIVVVRHVIRSYRGKL
jgi:tetratricopeptide (TPR) repeat protein